MKQKEFKDENNPPKKAFTEHSFSCGEAAPELGSPTVAHCYGERESHTSVWLAWRKKHTVKVHVQGHNDKGRRLVHCTQRTMLATSYSLFAERLRVSLVENVHLTKHMRTKCHPVCIHFVRKHCGKDTKKCLPQAFTLAMVRVRSYTYGSACVWMNMPADRQDVMIRVGIDKCLLLSEF